MKKPNHRDLAILGISLFIGIIIGWSIKAILDSRKEPVTIENPINEALKRGYDSLSGVISVKEAEIRESEKQDRITDSILINSNKVIKKDYDKLKSMDDSTFYNYLKSRFGTR